MKEADKYPKFKNRHRIEEFISSYNKKSPRPA